MKVSFFLILVYLTSGYSAAQENNFALIKTTDYELARLDTAEVLLVLFPCFPCNAMDTQREFDITGKALRNGVSILFMNYNRKLFMQEEEKEALANMLIKVIKDHQLPKNMVVGGFSGGGNVTLLLSNYLMKYGTIKPSKIFIVDAPVDLLSLYRTSEYHLKQDLDESVLGESTFLKTWFEQDLGNPDDDISAYERLSPYTHASNHLSNVDALEGVDIRFYTEPDIEWWKQRSNDTYEQLNAYSIEKMALALEHNFENSTIELIKTKNKGFRSDGTRHPHSWSIVDQTDLIWWILDN
ncbi:MAG: hypothetical protein AAGG59_15420 [Bacteroidota bacterium]